MHSAVAGREVVGPESGSSNIQSNIGAESESAVYALGWGEFGAEEVGRWVEWGRGGADTRQARAPGPDVVVCVVWGQVESAIESVSKLSFESK